MNLGKSFADELEILCETLIKRTLKLFVNSCSNAVHVLIVAFTHLSNTSLKRIINELQLFKTALLKGLITSFVLKNGCIKAFANTVKAFLR